MTEIPDKPFFTVIEERDIPYANHESDLYVPQTDETNALIKLYDLRGVTQFRNQVDGEWWYDIPFGYLPWWEANRR